MFLFVFLLYTSSICGQDHQTKSELEKEILGTWILEKDPRTKITFEENGIMRTFGNNKLRSTVNYEISETCNGEGLEEGFFLKVEEQDSGSSCSFIESINYNNNDNFTLITEQQGKIVVFTKEK